jgi:hypothetical protein
MEQTAMWRLRRIGPRAAEVAARYADHREVAEQARSMMPTLKAFIQAYDDVRRGDVPWTKDEAAGRQAAYQLVVAARMWLPLIVRDVVGVDRSNYLDSVICDDVAADVVRLISMLREAKGDSLPYREEAIAQLDRGLHEAQLRWAQAEATDNSYAERMNELRRRADDFHSQLECFTDRVAFALDHTNPDYLRLLLSHAWHHDATDDPDAPRPEVVEPATLVTGIPRALEAHSKP